MSPFAHFPSATVSPKRRLSDLHALDGTGLSVLDKLEARPTAPPSALLGDAADDLLVL